MNLRPISSLRPITPVGDSVYESDLSTAVLVGIANGASGLLVQAKDGDIYMAIGDSTIVADAEDFIINSEAVVPTIIELIPNSYVSFLEKDSGAGVTYQLIR